MLQVVRTSLSVKVLCTLGIALVALPSVYSAERKTSAVRIPEGKFLPQYGPGGSKKSVSIGSFFLDPSPVTQHQFSEFLSSHPEWKKGAVSALMAEKSYLDDWEKSASGIRPTPKKKNFPVVYVSYFAAAAFCESMGGRLPTTLEWEYVAQEEIQVQMDWLSNPKPPTAVGLGKANRFGIHDLYGQVWEWTEDYNSSFATADNRQDGELSKNLFCGAGSMNARDRKNYPAFMRYAMRSGLRPSYTILNLGFRCAYDSK